MGTKIKNELNAIDEERQSEDTDELELSTAQSEVSSEPRDESVELLAKQESKGKLILQPDFQRQYVWSPQKATRLIESAFMGIPLPVVYLAEEDDKRRSVIDGQQRLTTLFSYIKGSYPDGTPFKLGKMQVFKQAEKKGFQELGEELQDRVLNCLIHTITFKRGSDVNLKYNVFERLNTGSVSLNDQELRNCIFRGPYNDLLKELSQDKDFREIVGLETDEKRMRDVELVLRYCAFLNNGYSNYKSPIKRFLNGELAERRHISKEKEAEIRKCFKNSVSLIKSMLGKNAFCRFMPGTEDSPNGKREKFFNYALYDILMVWFARLDKNMVMRHLDAIRESYIDMQTNDPVFVEWLRVSTSSQKSVDYRFMTWKRRLDRILEDDKKEVRCFTLEFKKKLFAKSPVCAICKQTIQSIDDAAVDHIEQYWMGGKTIPENARLAHRYCNCIRPKDDVVTSQEGLPSWEDGDMLEAAEEVKAFGKKG